MNFARALTAAALVAAFLLGTTFQLSLASQLNSALHCKIKAGSPAAIAIADRPSEQNFKTDFPGSPLFATSALLAIPSLSSQPVNSLPRRPFHLAHKATFFIRAP